MPRRKSIITSGYDSCQCECRIEENPSKGAVRFPNGVHLDMVQRVGACLALVVEELLPMQHRQWLRTFTLP